MKPLSPAQLLTLTIGVCVTLFLVVVIANTDPGNPPRTVSSAPRTYGLDLHDPDPTLREVKRRIARCANDAGFASLASLGQSATPSRVYQDCMDATR